MVKKMEMKAGLYTVGTVIIISIGALSLVQFSKLQEHKKKLAAKETEIIELNNILDIESDKVNELSLLNQDYEDSILVLNTKIIQLEEELRLKEKNIKYLKGKLKRREIAYQNIKDKIALLYKKEVLDQQKIKQLEEEKAALRIEMNHIEDSRKEIVQAKVVTQKKIVTHQDNVTQIHSLKEAAQNTTVTFQEIKGKKFKNGRTIKRMKKNMNGWQYTDFKFTLNNSNHLALLDKQFVLRIHDLDNNLSLAYLEQNPRFTNNHERGLPFKFDGNTVELTFCNMQKKTSENYEVRIFMLHNGEEVAINNATKRIIHQGKFVQ